MNKEIFNPSVNDYFEKCTAFIQKSFLEYSLKPKDRTRMELLCEESLVRLTDNMTEGAMMEISVRASFGKVIVEMKARGEELTTLNSGSTIAPCAPAKLYQGFGINH